MFTHTVLFEIKPKFVKAYLKDCQMWAKKAKEEGEFIGYNTFKRADNKNQYASAYYWKLNGQHLKFMKANHENLLRKSQAPVKVLGYFNFESIQKM